MMVIVFVVIMAAQSVSRTSRLHQQQLRKVKEKGQGSSNVTKLMCRAAVAWTAALDVALAVALAVAATRCYPAECDIATALFKFQRSAE